MALNHKQGDIHGYHQVYFCDRTCWDAALKALSQKDASQNGIPERFFWHLFYKVRYVLLTYCSSFKQISIFCTDPESKTNLLSLTKFWVTPCVPEPIYLLK
jgi:hypothetical protein